MNLASLIQKGSLRGVATAIPATFATVAPFALPKVAKVATVAVAKSPDTPANDTAPTPAATLPGNDEAQEAGQFVPNLGTFEAATDPDRCCWPHGAAMTGSEIDTRTARLARFIGKGTNSDDGKALADKLVKRDRELDDRRLCLECQHLAGYEPGSWRCSNWQRSRVAMQARDAGLPSDLVRLLQRCDGFTNAINPTTKVSQ